MRKDSKGRNLKTIVTAKIFGDTQAGLAVGPISQCELNQISFTARKTKGGGLWVVASLPNSSVFGTPNYAAKARYLPPAYSQDRLWFALARCYWEAMDEKRRRVPIEALAAAFEAADLPENVLDEMSQRGRDIGVTDVYHDMTPTDVTHWTIALEQATAKHQEAS